MIYRDPLGRPFAKGTISVFGGTGSPKRYCFRAPSDAPEKQWRHETDIDTIINDMPDWDCTVRKDGRGEYVIDCIHRETQAAIDKIRRASEKTFANAERGYIRFGDLPKNGHSINHRDNTPEKGVSAFEAEFVVNKYRLILTPALEVSYLTVCDRPAYRLYGEVVGTGSDGEPLLRVAKTKKL